MTWKREATKFTKDTTLIKAVRMMREHHDNWALKCHLKMSMGKIMLSHGFKLEVMGYALMDARSKSSDRQGQEAISLVVVRNASQTSSIIKRRVEHFYNFMNLIELLCAVLILLSQSR